MALKEITITGLNIVTSGSSSNASSECCDVMLANSSFCDVTSCLCQRTCQLNLSVRIVLAVWLLAILGASVPGNAMVCWLVLRRAAMRSATNLLVVAMATADVLLTLTGIPSSMATVTSACREASVTGDWVVALVQTMFPSTSVLLLTVTSVDRYLVIAYGKGRLTPKKAGALGGGCVLAAIFVTLTLLIGIDLQSRPFTWALASGELDNVQSALLLLMSSLVCHLPILLMAYCFTCLVVMRRRAKRRVHCVNYDVNVTSPRRQVSSTLRQCSPSMVQVARSKKRQPRSSALERPAAEASATSSSHAKRHASLHNNLPSLQCRSRRRSRRLRSEVYVVATSEGRDDLLGMPCPRVQHQIPWTGKTATVHGPKLQDLRKREIELTSLRGASVSDVSVSVITTISSPMPHRTSSFVTSPTGNTVQHSTQKTEVSPTNACGNAVLNCPAVSFSDLSSDCVTPLPSELRKQDSASCKRSDVRTPSCKGVSNETLNSVSPSRFRRGPPASPSGVRRRPLSLQRRVRNFTTAGVLFLTALVCWVPYWVALLAAASAGTRKEGCTLLTVLQCLVYSRSALNPLVYAVRVRQYRQAWTKLLPSLRKRASCPKPLVWARWRVDQAP